MMDFSKVAVMVGTMVALRGLMMVERMAVMMAALLAGMLVVATVVLMVERKGLMKVVEMVA